MVRAAITTVNPDILALWRRSTGYTVDAAFKQQPTYQLISGVPIQVQALSANRLYHALTGSPAFVSMEPVLRQVYMYGNPQGIVRVDVKGGDLLGFAQVPGARIETWKIFQVYETWPDWACVGVVLQDDAPAAVWTADSATVLADSISFTADGA